MPTQISLSSTSVILFLGSCPACVAMKPVFARAVASPDFANVQFCMLNCDDNDETRELAIDLIGVS